MQTFLINPIRFLLFIIILFLLGNCSERKIPPKAVKGVLDLRELDLDPLTPSGTRKTDGIINLDGEWEFYWEEFPTAGAGGVLHSSRGEEGFYSGS
jgi:hypothetical protein